MDFLEQFTKIIKTLPFIKTTIPPQGSTVEIIGLPGSGKHLVAPILQYELSKRGWINGIPRSNIFKESDYNLKDIDYFFVELLEKQIRRLKEDGCKLPYLSEYIRHSASIISRYQSLGISRSSNPAYFINESILHHFGPEILQILLKPTTFSEPENQSQKEIFKDHLINNRRFVFMTFSPWPEILQRLRNRKGQKVSWDW